MPFTWLHNAEVIYSNFCNTWTERLKWYCEEGVPCSREAEAWISELRDGGGLNSFRGKPQRELPK